VIVLAHAACGGRLDELEPTTAVSEDEFPRTMAVAQCASFTPCCDAAGAASDLGACAEKAREQLTDGLELAREVGLQFDPTAAGACIAALRRDAAAGTCRVGLPSDGGRDVCARIFRGDRPPGARCERSFECDPGRGGAICHRVTTDGEGRCLRFVAAREGAACLPYTADQAALIAAGRHELAHCDPSADLRCDPASLRCVRLPDAGGRCDPGGAPTCASTARCDARTARCVGRPPPSPAGGPCGDEEGRDCARGAACDVERRRCVETKGPGAACTIDAECEGGARLRCKRGVCLLHMNEDVCVSRP